MPSTKCEGLSYPNHFLKSRGSVIRNDILEYRTKQASLFLREEMFFMPCMLQISKTYTQWAILCSCSDTT